MTQAKCFIAINELSLVRQGTLEVAELRVTSPLVAVNAVRSYLANAYRENVVVLGLDAEANMIGISTAGQGGIDHCLIRPRHIYDRAYRMNAVGIVVAHNHTNGKPGPSSDDLKFMRKLIALGAELDCPLRDFIITGDGTDKYWSARNETYEV